MELQTGTAAKEAKAAEEDSLTRLSNLLLWPSEIDAMKEAQEKQKAAECSVNQLDEESSSEEVFGVCKVCLKDKEHWTFECPYLDCIPNPNDATVGKDYLIVCKECGMLGGHPERDWEGRALTELDGDSDSDEESEEEEVFGVCDVCLKDKEHWTFECPYLDCIPNPKDTTVGKNYLIVCKECGKLGGHPERDWEGRAMLNAFKLMTQKPDGYDEWMKLHTVTYV